jgi:DNA-directed RNA polymerase specialized sigma24 family protein
VPEQHYKGVEWKKVIDRLLAYEITLFRVAGYLDRQISGKSAGDFTNEAVIRLLDPTDSGVEWADSRGKPTTDSVFVFLAHVVKNDFIDAKKLPRHKRTEELVDEGPAPAATPVAKRPSHATATNTDAAAADHIDYLRKREELLAAAAEDADVLFYLRLQLGDEGYNGYPPRRVAELLDKSVAWVNNIKKRSIRFLEAFNEATSTKA